MSFIRIMSLYYCRHILSFVTDVETFSVTNVPEDAMAAPVLMCVAYVLWGVSVYE